MANCGPSLLPALLPRSTLVRVASFGAVHSDAAGVQNTPGQGNVAGHRLDRDGIACFCRTGKRKKGAIIHSQCGRLVGRSRRNWVNLEHDIPAVLRPRTDQVLSVVNDYRLLCHHGIMQNVIGSAVCDRE